MDTDLVREAKEVAIDAIMRAGQIAKEHFDKITALDEKGDFGDVVTEVDYLTEELILNEVGRAFPEHQIHSEESGDNGKESDWLWMIDPLDGTNNYAIGLPVFSLSITLMHKREPVLGVIYEPMVDRLYVTSRNEGSYCNHRKMQLHRKDHLKKSTIGWIQGHHVQNERQAVTLRQHLDVSFKRVMKLWAPTLQWCLLANGSIDGIVLYNSEGDDLYSGVLMVKEAGGIVLDFEGRPFEGMNEEPYLIACHPENKQHFLEVIRAGLSG